MSNKGKNTNRPLLYVTILVFSSVLILGCEESLKGPPSAIHPDPVNIQALTTDATHIIAQALEDPDPRIKVNAIEVVADTRRITMMPKVRKLMMDDFVPVRFAAALAVGDAEYLLAKKTVRQLLTDGDENVRIAAAYAAGKLWAPEGFTYVRKAVQSTDQTTRANATMLLGKIGDNSDAELALKTLQDDDSEDKVRMQAVETMARLGDNRAYAKLWAMLINKFADVRIMAVAGMGALGTEEAKNALITTLDDDVLEIRLAAAEQLGMLGETSGQEKVLEVFEANLTANLPPQDIERVYLRTALAIGRICTPELTGYLPRLLRDQSKNVRIAAAKAVFQCTMNK